MDEMIGRAVSESESDRTVEVCIHRQDGIDKQLIRLRKAAGVHFEKGDRVKINSEGLAENIDSVRG